MHPTRRTLLAASATLAAPAVLRAQGTTTISFYFPVAVGGPITRIIDGYARDFEAETPGVKVQPIYAGGYTDVLTKAQTALKAGQGPTMAVLLAVDAHSLIDDDLIVPFDSVAGSAADKAWLDSFYPAFLANGRIGGHTWGVPFQRSTIVMYWNKQAFAEVGLNPDTAPATWADHAAAAAKLTKKEGGGVARWGTLIPATGFTYWLYQGLVTQAGGTLANGEGTQVSFNAPAAVAALEYWLSLQQSGATPPGLVEWGTTPRDFLEGRAGMIWTTTGNLSNIRANAKFPFGVGLLPQGVQRGSPTGGGNFVLFKAANPAERQAALQFLRWVTTPERAAQWGIDTGYVAVRPDAWETPRMKEYVASFPPAAVARDQLQYAVPELSTHDNQRVTQALNDGLQAALTGRKQPGPALAEAQATAERLLRPFR